MADVAGRALGSRYQLTQRLGEGAMGEVWRARDLRTDTPRAAKLLKSSLANDRDIVARFIQERHILLSLDHPGIVRVRDLVVEGDDLAIVMDLIEGGDLRGRLRENGTFTPRQAVGVTIAVLDALGAAHAQHCLHRDIKPDNVLLTRPGSLGPADVRLTDFGIARLAQESTVQMTGLLGTPGYMPPELFAHGQFSAASDLYAVGVLLYELLGGRTPFAGPGTALTVGHRHVSAEPPPLPVAPDLWRVVASMLAKDPRQRLTVSATAAALRALPASVLDVAPLPVQPVPSSWATAASAGSEPGSGPRRVEIAEAGLDVGATFVGGAPVYAGPPSPPGGPGPALDVTQVGPRRALPPTAPVPGAATPAGARAARSRKAAWPWVLGAAAALVAIIGVVVVVGIVGGGTDAEAGSQGSGGAVTAESTDPGLASTLGIARTATWDPETRVAEVTFTLEATGSGLDGPFLQVLPIPAGSADTQCPLVTFTTGDGRAVPRGTKGVQTACAYELDATIERQDDATLVADVPLDLATGDDAPGAGEQLQAWLDAVGDDTQSGLEQIRSGTDYAAQRITGIEVEVAGPVIVYDPIRVTVTPQWTSGGGATDPLFVTGADAGGDVERSSVIDQLTGGAQGGFSLDPCEGGVLQQGLNLEAQQPGPCSITADLGALPEAEADFTINGLRN